MKLTKVKLISGGGISIAGVEYVASRGGVSVAQDFTKRRRTGTSHELITKIMSLRYFFLNLTGHWIEPFDKYYDTKENLMLPVTANDMPMGEKLMHTVMNKTKITGLNVSDGSFSISGEIESFGEKSISITTRPVTEDDDAGFYSDCSKLISSILTDVTSLFRGEAAIEVPEKFALDIAGKRDPNADPMSKAEILQSYIDVLEKNGAVILMSSDMSDPQEDDEKIIVAEEVSDDEPEEDIDLDVILPEHEIEPEQVEAMQEQSDQEQAKEFVPVMQVVKTETTKTQTAKDKKINGNRGVHAAEFNPIPATAQKKEASFDNEPSDDDIKAVVDDSPVTQAQEFIVTARKKQTNSTLASEREFADIMPGSEPAGIGMDLQGAEYSDSEMASVEDDWASDLANG